MQLILDTEPSTDINDKMTTLEESSETNLKNSIDTCKNEKSNGNKENVESQPNIVDAGNVEDLKQRSDDSIGIPVANLKLNNEINVERENLVNKTEDVISKQNIENGNNLHNYSETNGNEMECEEIISAETEKIQNILEVTAHKEIQDTIPNHEENINMNTECVEMVEADKLGTVNNLIKDEEVDQAEDEISSSHNDIKLDINNQKEGDLNNQDSKISNSTEDNIVEDDAILEDLETLHTGAEENIESNSIVKDLELIESEAEESSILADISDVSRGDKTTENVLANLVENQSAVTVEVQKKTEDTLTTGNSDQFDKEVDYGTEKMDDDDLEKAVDDHLEIVPEDPLKQVVEEKNKAAGDHAENQAGDQLNLVAEDESEQVKAAGDHAENQAGVQLNLVVEDESEQVEAAGDHAENQAGVQLNLVAEDESEQVEAAGDHAENQAGVQPNLVVEDESEQVEAAGDHAANQAGVQRNLVVEDESEQVEAAGDHAENQAGVQPNLVVEDESEQVQAAGDHAENQARVQLNLVVEDESEQVEAAGDHAENKAGVQLNLVVEDESEQVVDEHQKNKPDDQPKQEIKDKIEDLLDNHVEKKEEVVIHKLVKMTVSELDKVAEEATLGDIAKSKKSEVQKEVDGDLKQKPCDELQKEIVERKDSVLFNNDVVPENKSVDDSMECDVSAEGDLVDNMTACDKGQTFDVDRAKEIVEQAIDTIKEVDIEATEPIMEVEVKKSFCKLSNTLDILSDDDDDDLLPTDKEKNAVNTTVPAEKSEDTDKQCINIEDDDDIMLIDEDTDIKDSSEPVQKMVTEEKKEEPMDECTIDLEKSTENTESKEDEKSSPDVQKDLGESDIIKSTDQETIEKTTEIQETTTVFEKKEENKKPLVAQNLLEGCKKNLADMTRDELEEFCILKIVEGIVDRSNLSEIKTKLKTMTQNIDEFKKKALMLTKQNRDLQLVLKSVQEEQKKKSETAIIPLKITRSVGMQVLMTEKPGMRKKAMPNVPAIASSNVNTRAMNNRNQNTSPRQPKPAPNTQQIPVPRLVPAMTNPAVKAANTTPQVNAPSNSAKTSNQAMNGMKVQTPQKAEKRPHNRVQSVTVDLTDDEPPTKVTPRSSPAPPVRLVSPQNLLQRPQFTQSVNTPRKVYIPISGPQSQNIRPGQTIMLKSVGPPPGAPGQRIRGPAPRMPQNAVRMTRVQGTTRHPAPLPECLKQYQPPNWKALPPAPDLKLSKVENGIVISWKIEGYQEDSYEEIASYQLYAYQETSSPPSTALWKKIGDVKALPLPMACTLTQFMAGFKYYFAVRAVDVRSRLGPFSLPGSILLLNKM